MLSAVLNLGYVVANSTSQTNLSLIIGVLNLVVMFWVMDSKLK